MANSYNKQSRGLISNAFGVAKKLTSTGFDLLTHAAPGSISKLNQTPEDHQIIEGKAKEKVMTEEKKIENPQQMIREHFPKVTQQLLGRHYNKVNNVTSFISPNLNNKIADYFFDKLEDFASSVSSVDHVLKEVGAKTLDELSSDPSRSTRISAALANQNKVLAAIQGAITGATGVIGAAVDIPSSLTLTLRAIYQTGRAHGFELNREHERDVVEYVFREVDLGTIAEKQTVLVAVRALANLLETRDIHQLQAMLGSSNDFSVIQKWFSQEDGTVKWNWLNYVPKISVLSKLSPLAGAGVGAFYSWKLIDDANRKAELVFSNAQHYLAQHPNESLNILTAYEKSKELRVQASPLLLKENEKPELKTSLDLDSVVDQVDNDAIKEIRIEQKTEEKAEPESVADGLKKLAEQHVEVQKDDSSKSDALDVQQLNEKDASAKNEKSSVNAKASTAKANSVVKDQPDSTAAKGEAKVANATTAKKQTTTSKRTQTKKQANSSSSLTKKVSDDK